MKTLYNMKCQKFIRIKRNYRFLIQNIIFIGCLVVCTDSLQTKDTLFSKLSVEATGVEFNNLLTESEDFNILEFDYIYNGAGVAATDLTGNGLPDLFFTGNQVSCRLYLNQGDFQFIDVTEQAGLLTHSWTEGVTIGDLNGDGLPDLYVSVSNREDGKDPNLLFVHQGLDENGIPRFREMAADYGLDLVGYFTQAAFFDYDKDGHMDLYLLANAMETFQRNTSRPRNTRGDGKSNDRLLRNNGNGSFIDVTLDAGIKTEGYGLGLVISDLNGDGWPDIYVANDFITNDLMYINQQDGTFRNEISERTNHQSFNAMGADVGDVNDDGWPDIVVLDMFPPDNFRQKTMFSLDPVR
jgi:hypothetical protein